MMSIQVMRFPRLRPSSVKHIGCLTRQSARRRDTVGAVGAVGGCCAFGSQAFDESAPKRRPPIEPHPISPTRKVPAHIKKPPYADTGSTPTQLFSESILLHDSQSIRKMRDAARLARKVLDFACSLAEPGVTTDSIDEAVHNEIIRHNAYPSPLNYMGFPKSVCSSINEVICHGIPDARPLQLGDVVSFDVSCFLQGVHGDNCATVVVGDRQDRDEGQGTDWRGEPHLTLFSSPHEEQSIKASRRLVRAARESLYAAIDVARPGACLSHIGCAIHDVADHYSYDTVERYRGHGISHVFHCAPLVKHYRNNDRMELKPGMIFTIEPMLTAGNSECREWADEWTVVTVDGSDAAQFEHTILITEEGNEILTLPESEWTQS